MIVFRVRLRGGAGNGVSTNSAVLHTVVFTFSQINQEHKREGEMQKEKEETTDEKQNKKEH